MPHIFARGVQDRHIGEGASRTSPGSVVLHRPTPVMMVELARLSPLCRGPCATNGPANHPSLQPGVGGGPRHLASGTTVVKSLAMDRIPLSVTYNFAEVCPAQLCTFTWMPHIFARGVQDGYIRGEGAAHLG